MKAGDLRLLVKEITSFNRDAQAIGKPPEEYFIPLKALERRFLIPKPEKNESFSNGNHIGYLPESLTEAKWKLTKDIIDDQPSLDCDEKLEIL